jgi:beta-mannosidase
MAKWRRTGIIWWNIMDGWPQFSDAVVDYYFAKKLAYFFIRRSQQDVCVMLNEPESWNQNIVVSNDTRNDYRLSCQIRDIDTDEVVFTAECLAPADRSTTIGQIPYIRNRQRFFVITWQGDVAGSNHYLAGQPPFTLEQVRSWLNRSGLYEVTV